MKKVTVAMILLVSLFPLPTKAQTVDDKGLEIVLEADNRDTGWGDSKQKLVMTLRNKHGEKSKREIRGRSLEVPGDGDKSLTIFDTPKDVKGTAFLNFTHKVGDDDQWLYLPALKRVKRISSRNKSGSFMGSEFSYEDISSQEVEKYTYRWIRDEVFDDKECFVVEFYPVDKKYSGYTKMINWIGKAEYRTWKVEYYDRKESLLKSLTMSSYKKYIDKFWRAGEMNMVNHQNGKSTQILFDNYQFQLGLKDRDFNKNSLKRMR